MDEKDLQSIRGIVVEVVDKSAQKLKTELKSELKAELHADIKEVVEASAQKLKSELKAEFRDELRIHQDIQRQENKAMESSLLKKIEEAKQEVIDGVGDIVDNGIHPQLENHEKRIVKLEVAVSV